MGLKEDLREADNHLEQADRLLRSVARDTVEATEENLSTSSNVNVHEGTIDIEISHQVTLDKLNANLPHPYIARQTENGGIQIAPLEVAFDPNAATGAQSRDIKELISILEESNADGAPEAVVIRYATDAGFDKKTVRHAVDILKQKGEVYEPTANHLRTT